MDFYFFYYFLDFYINDDNKGTKCDSKVKGCVKEVTWCEKYNNTPLHLGPHIVPKLFLIIIEIIGI